MDVLKSGNLLLRFALELCALAALAYWGATTTLRLPGRIGAPGSYSQLAGASRWCGKT
jgi:hypothetical protein